MWSSVWALILSLANKIHFIKFILSLYSLLSARNWLPFKDRPKALTLIDDAIEVNYNMLDGSVTEINDA